ncbi:FixH family protein [Ulvibacter antarcticus]|uniref:FixH protein n=1 Tax=Ulvibacter antarcticus TaxID=442714 RepID=A0A3L9YKS0_9FLAO|nr:FixH family protein [Ulvibacter antarcticus]RMA58725.1 FixH protein [Ulvibacter antarcticus]
MKINWGTGIVIAIVLFMSFILFMVIKMTTQDEFSHDLVVEEYYQKELAYQTEIDAEENLSDFTRKIYGKKTEAGWLLTFPDELRNSTIDGTVFLYRPSNKQLDFQFPMKLSDVNLLIPNERLLDGRWNITVEWKLNEKNYMYKESILY